MFKSGLFLKAVRQVCQQVCQQRLYCDAAEVGANLQGAKSVLTGERGINKVILVGRVGQDPQVRGSTQNPVTVFSLATSYTLKTREGEYVQKTEWHRISVFRPVLKDLVNQFIKKGDKVYVSGSISYSQFKDKDDVVQRATNIIAEDVMNMTRPMRGPASEPRPADGQEDMA